MYRLGPKQRLHLEDSPLAEEGLPEGAGCGVALASQANPLVLSARAINGGCPGAAPGIEIGAIP